MNRSLLGVHGFMAGFKPSLWLLIPIPCKACRVFEFTETELAAPQWLKQLHTNRKTLWGHLSSQRPHVERGRSWGAFEIICSSGRKVVAPCMSLLLEGLLQVQSRCCSRLSVGAVLGWPQSWLLWNSESLYSSGAQHRGDLEVLERA